MNIFFLDKSPTISAEYMHDVHVRNWYIVFHICRKGSKMSEAEKIDILRKALVGLVGSDSKEELEQLEMVIRVMPVPEVDRMNTINAVQALLQTLPEAK